jgi:transcription initiation factor TFIID subunit 1
VIETEIKNVYREPLKHSEVATRFDFVKFTFEEECFGQLHRFNFAFQEHLATGRVRVELVPQKMRKSRANGLVVNSEMRESNDKFSRKEDLSLVKGEFILVEYLEESPLLLSDVGMCERMIVQVNYL